MRRGGRDQWWWSLHRVFWAEFGPNLLDETFRVNFCYFCAFEAEKIVYLELLLRVYSSGSKLVGDVCVRLDPHGPTNNDILAKQQAQT
jgi:hypothetical protein